MITMIIYFSLNKKALAQMSERAGREYGGNDVLAFAPKA
jgi:hypothetical protein